ncbi:extracellular solute-binding protein [Streptomyces sp. MP131-18]|uniref:extracellular solute-binding protein n=1 Tax=Streptomyces sp. MP131-18 TaxID=1857892 RepID=UPI0009D2D811|nr:extracellular solute-binding protein [Streptomyces sp. MP131-18]ONK11323.1 Maltose-binding periplasmic domain-containing protein [Streptomyces sp. MP131-18]
MTSSPRPARRLMTALALLLPATACGLGGGTQDPPLAVLGPWTGAEERDFERQLASFEETYGIDVAYEGTTATRDVLLSGVQSGDPPDIAILPGLGDLADYAARGLLYPLPGDAVPSGAFDAPWLARPAGPEEERYWVPVKVDLKSMVWHEAGLDPARGGPPGVAQWCLGMLSDATSGWPGTDWIEDILLQQSGADVYNAWATGQLPWTDEAVVAAWETWGTFMAGDEEAAPAALRTDHRGRDGRGGLLLDGGSGPDGCTLEHQGSFARSLYDAEDARRLDFTPSARLLPGAAPDAGRDVEVSADFAALFRENEDAETLLAFLADVETQTARAGAAEDPGPGQAAEWPLFSAHNEVLPAHYPAGVSRRIAEQLHGAERLCLDASDVMSPTVGRLFYEKVLEFLADPLQDPEGLLAEIQLIQDQPPHVPALEQVCG